MLSTFWVDVFPAPVVQLKSPTQRNSKPTMLYVFTFTCVKLRLTTSHSFRQPEKMQGLVEVKLQAELQVELQADSQVGSRAVLEGESELGSPSPSQPHLLDRLDTC
jgi:hypothetical protein